MFASSTLLVTSLLAPAVHSYFVPTPLNGYLGNGRANVTCSALGMNVTFNGEFAATGPLVLEAGQPFYANDVAGNLTVPAALGAIADTLLVDHIDVRVFLDLLLTNLEPAVLNPIPNGLWVNGTKLNRFSDTKLQFPVDGSVLGGFGPITAGAADTVGLVYLGDILAELYLYSAANTLILGPVNATCPAPVYNALLATFNTVEATSAHPPTLSPANGYLVDYPPLEDGTQFGCLDFEYSCAVGSKGTYPFRVSTCTGAGFVYTAGQSYDAFNSTSRITIPEDLVAGLKGFYPSVASIQPDLESLFLRYTNAQPSTINAIPKGGLSQKVAVPASGDLTFYVPDETSPGLNFGPVTIANAGGQTADIFIGNSSSKVTYLDSTGKVLGSDDIFCTPKVPNLEAIGILIVPEGTPYSEVGI